MLFINKSEHVKIDKTYVWSIKGGQGPTTFMWIQLNKFPHGCYGDCTAFLWGFRWRNPRFYTPKHTHTHSLAFIIKQSSHSESLCLEQWIWCHKCHTHHLVLEALLQAASDFGHVLQYVLQWKSIYLKQKLENMFYYKFKRYSYHACSTLWHQHTVCVYAKY